ncbi:type I methionyl aminopeptidase [Microbacterium sp. EYE_5]|uniref:type I methionyl aminopeptidase n=1 Tax=unclassified Microbacterium TaxID=2609290 RepID=UPI0020056E28|nr:MULTISPECIES: type I methionyl aminopeptidase [unclassified Microbacterium]MCK6079081.1 type I methionyl aminopeptidase [Microbacterium sp. EYE_382]MCK6084351.1 type I methionyl aminopeptidase [Microbacterium sp. EYE_384]MCK6123420.1 type I methionyl aminopeptidase [Microbacterium sp. EYE_80]MCK6125115.1 type I methionyl aminopeptidase [Microbacterium sp. EYE_79]MCK6140035.1 type I methionyl aminopeptidase [Microbacterium sp. EYE_39]
MAFRRSIYKSSAQLRAMVEPGLITAAALDALRPSVVAGVTTAELDAIAHDTIVARGAESNFQLVRGYRHTTCISVNEQVVHGIPGERALAPGDIVSIDCGAQFQGWNGDSAITVVVPDPDRPDLVAARQRLSDVTEGSLWAGVAALANARRVGEIGDAVQTYIESSGEGYGILRDYVGHGIGRKMHEGPTVFNYRVSDLGPEVKPGLCVAIEPMVVAGDEATLVEDDDWTVSTVDGTDGSHWEHSVAVHDGGIWVLTAPDGGAAKLAAFGVTPTPIS